MSRFFYTYPALLLLLLSGGLQLCLLGCAASTSVPAPVSSLPAPTFSPVPVSSLPAPTSSPAPVSRPRFQIRILDQTWGDVDFGYTREAVWPALKKMDEAASVGVITEDDIETYDWSRQTITLTPEATIALRKSFTDDAFFKGETLKQVFVVTYDGEWLYGGVFSHAGSAAGIQFPVICLDDVEAEQVVLRLRSENTCWRPDEAGAIFQVPAVRTLFAGQGKLVE